LLAGAILLAEAVATGGARVYLFLVIPVFTGTTLAFGLSAVLLVLGVFLIPLAFVREEAAETAAPNPSAPAPSAPPADRGSGGVILVGPIPIFFGSWRRNPPIPYRWAVLLGALLAVVAILLLWGFSVL
jgi:uncharacterized membrane protein